MSLPEILKKQFWLTGVIGVCLLAAILFFMAVSQTRIDIPIRGDARDYFAYAYNLETHGIYSRTWPSKTGELPSPDALRAPGYGFFVSLFFVPESPASTLNHVLYCQAALGVLTVLVYLILYRRFMPTGWALGAGLITAISPHLVNASVYLLTETLFTFLLGAHLLVLERALRLKEWRWAMLAGLLLAMSLLVRPTTQYLVLAYLVAFPWVLRTRWREYAKCLVWLLIPVVIAAAAWSARNLIATGHTSDPTLTASFLHHGMYVNMMYDDRPETYGYPYRFDPKTNVLAENPEKVLEAIRENFSTQPQRYLSWYLLGKPLQFFSWNLTESVGDAFIYAPLQSPYFEQPLFRATRAIAYQLHPFLIVLSLAGAFFAISRTYGNMQAALLGIVLAYFILFHMIGAPFPRYSIPLRPVNYGLAFFAMHVLLEWIRKSRKTP